jgi:hypothetical protein
LAYSHDKGNTWKYWRGQDYADKVRGLYNGPPDGWREEPGAILTEDYVNCLAEANDGSLWIGYRSRGWQRIAPLDGHSLASAAEPESKYFITSILAVGDRVVWGTYGDLPLVITGVDCQNPPAASEQIIPRLPSAAKPMSPDSLRQMVQALVRNSKQPGSKEQPTVMAIEDDWRTQGNWLGRYGRYWACLDAMVAPEDYLWGTCSKPVAYRAYIGSHHAPGDCLRYWVGLLNTSDPRVLEMPSIYLDSRVRMGSTTWDNGRRRAEWDDHGEDYPAAFEGPNIYCDLSVPPGMYVLSLYFITSTNPQRGGYRDFRMSISRNARSTPAYDNGRQNNLETLSHARFKDFWGGVYKKFLVTGPIDFTIEIQKQGSENTNVSAVMLDSLEEQPLPYFPNRTHEAGSQPRANTRITPTTSEEFMILHDIA